MYRIISSTLNYVLVTTALIAAKVVPLDRFELSRRKAADFKSAVSADFTIVALVGHAGLEPTTKELWVPCSNQLS